MTTRASIKPKRVAAIAIAVLGVAAALVFIAQRQGADTELDERQQASRDHKVLETALERLLESEDFQFKRKVNDKARVLVHDATPDNSGMLGAEQIKSELARRADRTIPRDVEASLRDRNDKVYSWVDLGPQNDRIAVADLNQLDLTEGMDETKPSVFETYPDAVAWVQAWRPGYSKDGQTAVVRLWIGPTAHGACGTCLLVCENGVWRVKWCHFAFFA